MQFKAVYRDGKLSTYSSLFDRNSIDLLSTKLVRIFALQQIFRDRISPKQYLIHLVVSTLLLQANPVLFDNQVQDVLLSTFSFKNSSNLIVIVFIFCSRFNLLLLSNKNKYHHKHLGKLDKFPDIFIFLISSLGQQVDSAVSYHKLKE